MNMRYFLGISVICVMLFGAYSTTVRAGEADHKTIFTFSVPVEIPGQVLVPGTYVFEPVAHSPNILQIFREDANGYSKHIVATLSMTAQNLTTRADKPMVTLSEARLKGPELLVAWYYPGDKVAADFRYSRAGKQNPLLAKETVTGTLAPE